MAQRARRIARRPRPPYNGHVMTSVERSEQAVDVARPSRPAASIIAR